MPINPHIRAATVHQPDAVRETVEAVLRSLRTDPSAMTALDVPTHDGRGTLMNGEQVVDRVAECLDIDLRTR